MKLVLAIAAGVLIAALIGWLVSDPDGFRHKLWGYSKEEIDQSFQDVDRAAEQSRREIEARTFETEVQIVELRHGAAVAATYRLCHMHPPTTKQHQLECKRLDEHYKRDDAPDAKHPW